MSNVMRWPPSNRHLSPASVEVIRAVQALSRDQHQHGRYTFYPYTLKYKFKYQFNIKNSFYYSTFTSRGVRNPLSNRDSKNDKYEKCLLKLDG